MFKQEFSPILHNFFQKTEEETLPNLLYEANITLIPKAIKDSKKKKTNSKIISKALTNRL